MKKTGLFTHIAFTVGLFCCSAVCVAAANYQVNTNADNETDGCAMNACTLREAVSDANTLTPDELDSITFAAGVTNIALINDEIIITDPVIIGSPTATSLTTILGNMSNFVRIFNIRAAGDDTTLNRLELANGFAADNGGAIKNNGAVLNVNDCYIRDNEANGGFGGGIWTSGGTVNINRSTIGGTAAGNSNRANGGGGIFNFNGTVNLTNSTVTNNFAGNIGGGYYGFSDLSTATLNSTSSTIAFNVAGNGGGIAVSSTSGLNSRAFINNTIVSNNTASAPATSDVSDTPLVAGFIPGTITSTGFNIIGNTGGAAIFTFPPGGVNGDQLNAGANAAGLLPLAANGGLTPAHALRLTAPVSTAVDKGGTAQKTDQRGFTRDDDFTTIPPATGGNNTDIGAFEAQIGATAAAVSVSGRVTSGSGKGIARARVSVTDSNGATRRATTNFFGYYRFAEVAVGETYIFDIHSKFRSFNSQVVTINEELTDLNFVADF